MILEPQKKIICHYFHFLPSIYHKVMELDAMILVFLIFSFKPALSLSSFTLVKRPFSSSLLSAIRMVSSRYLWLLIFLPPILIPAYNLSSLAFLMMCSAYGLNKQGGSRHPCCTSFFFFIVTLLIFLNLILFLNFTILYWFCQISK